MSVRTGKECSNRMNRPADRPTDVAFLSNGPIILFNFSIFLPSSIGSVRPAFQPFVARGVIIIIIIEQPLPLSPQNDRNHLPFWSSKLKSPSGIALARWTRQTSPLLWPPVVFIITRSFSSQVQTPTPFATNRASKGGKRRLE